MGMHPFTIYFTPHLSWHPEELSQKGFLTSFDACDTFLLEMAKQWLWQEPDLEADYNRLSVGEIDEIPSERLGEIEKALGGHEFEERLKEKIHRSKKRIVLERIPVPPVRVEKFNSQLVDKLVKCGVSEAVALCRDQRQRIASNMIQRDTALLELIRAELAAGRRLFSFRGAAHEQFLCHLLGRRGIDVKAIRYDEPSVLERLATAMTMGKQAEDVDVQRSLYWILSAQKLEGDYDGMMAISRRAESMNENQLLSELEQLRRRERQNV
jgi:hypothetical protein